MSIIVLVKAATLSVLDIAGQVRGMNVYCSNNSTIAMPVSRTSPKVWSPKSKAHFSKFSVPKNVDVWHAEEEDALAECGLAGGSQISGEGEA